jgi:hypothetical protein
MQIKEFEQLSPKRRREFLIHSCQYVMSLNVADDLITDLFYYSKENFFVEVYYSVLWEKFLEMTAFRGTERVMRYLKAVDFGDVLESLNTSK